MPRLVQFFPCVSAFFSAHNRFSNRTVRGVVAETPVGRAGVFGALGKRCVRFAGVVVLALGAVAMQAQTASLTVTTSTVASGINLSSGGLCVDGSGNLYVASASSVYKLTLTNGAYSAPVTLLTGLGSLGGISVDGAGNMYLAAYGVGKILKYPYSASTGTYGAQIVLESGVSPSNIYVDGAGSVYFPNTTNSTIVKLSYANGVYAAPVNIGSGFNNPQGVKNDSAGNIYVADYGNAAVKKIPYSNGTYGATVTIGSGVTGPNGVVVDNSGNVFVADATNVKEIPYSNGIYGAAIAVGSGFNTPYDVAIDALGNVYELDGGSGSVKEIGITVPTFGTVTLGSNTTSTVSFTFLTGGTIKAPALLTQGATGLDFTDAGTGTCTTNGAAYSYAAGATCTVVVKFTPKATGLRTGAVELLNSSGAIIATELISGVGKGPLLTFNAPTGRTMSVPAAPRAIAIDASGDIYDPPASNVLYKVSSAGVSTALYTGAAGANYAAAAVDGAGDVYIVDRANDVLVEVGPTGTLLRSVALGASSANSLGAVALGADGTAYVADPTDGKVITVTQAGIVGAIAVSGYTSGNGVAVDSAGVLYVTLGNSNSIAKILKGSQTNVTPTGAALNAPNSLAVDAAGDLFVTNGSNGIVVVTAAGVGTALTTTGLSTGFVFGIALDGAGGLYFPDQNTGVVNVVNLASNTAYSFPSTYVYSTTASQRLLLTNIGNAALTFTDPTTGGNPSISTGFSIGNSSTCPQLTSSSSAGTLASGASCTDLISFAPTVSGSIGGSVVTSDNTLNVAGSAQAVALSGTGLAQLTKTINFPALATPVTVSSSATLAATASNGDPVAYTVTSGTATIVGTTITFSSVGSVTIAANSAETPSYQAAATVSQTITVSAAPTGYSAPTEPVGTVSAVQTAYVNITAAGTLKAVNVLTKGSPNVDFKLVSGGTCTTTTVYSVGQACSVEYSFTPTAAGVRIGGITLVNSAGAVLGSSYLGGTGTAPVGVFNAGVQSTFYNVGDGGQNGMTLDGAGDLYYSDLSSGAVYEVKVGTQTPILIASGLGISTDVAVDGIGDIFFGSDNQNTIFELKAGSTTPILLDTPLNPEYFAVDAAGNLFAAIAGTHVVKEYLANGTTATFGTGLSHPQAIALDASDNIYLTDRGLNEVLKITPANVQTVLASGFGFPVGIAMDPAGNIYVADTSNNAIDMLAAGTYALSQVSSGWSAPKPLFMDAAGNLYVANTGTGTIIELNRSAGSLSFGSTSYGAASAAQQTAFVNIGNEPLAISAVTASTNFQVDASNTCSVGNLASGANCVLAADFAPQAVGSLTGTLTVTDNSLNQASFAQITSLSGTATQASQTISFTAPASPVTYGAAPIALVATGGASGNAVTFSMVSGPGSISGNTLSVLGAGTIVIAANQAGSTNYLAATQVTQTVAVNPATLTAAIIGSPSKTYNGSASAALTASNYQLSGLAGADNFTVTQSVGAYASANAGTQSVTATLTASNFTVVSGSLSNYTLPATASGPGTITTASAFVTPNAATKIYGTADPMLSGTLTGFVASDNVTASYSRAAGANAGSYTISAVLGPTAVLSNYNITYNTAVFNITQASASVTPNAATKVYGTADPMLSGTLAGFVASDNVTASYSRAAGANIGSYTISALLSPAAVLSNYNIAYNTATFTITQAAQRISFSAPASPVTFGVAPIALVATGGASGNAVTFSIVSGPGSISGNTLSVLGAGTIVIAADQAGNTNYVAAAEVMQTVVVNLAPQIISFTPVPASPDVAGDSVVLSASGGPSGNPVVFSVLSGNASLADDGVTLTYTGAGTVVVAADQAAGGNYATATEATVTIIVNPVAAAYNAGTVPVASQSSVLTVTLNFPNGGTLGSLSYLTQGTANLDYIGCTTGAQTKQSSNSKGGTPRQTTFTCPSSKSKGGAVIPVCSAGTVYSAGQICTVSYIFQPTAPGQRLGAIAAVDANGNPMGTSYLSGLGTGPQAAFYPGTQSVIDDSHAGDPFEVATDAAGDIYLGSFLTSQILKYTPNGGVYTQSTIGGGFGTVAQIVVDGAGNLLVADPQNSQVLAETLNPSNGQYTQSVLFNSSNSSDNSAWAVAKDASGNVFLSGSGQLLMESPLPAGGYAERVLPFSFNFVTSLALDSSGDLFVADAGAGTLYELTNNGNGNYTQSVVVSGYGNLNGVAVDASGVVYASSTSTSSVLRYAPVAGGGYAPLAPLGGGFARLNGVGLDSAGNVYVADDGGPNTLSVIQVSSPASLSFVDTNVGSASSSNPQTVTVANSGYDPNNSNPLVLSSVLSGTTNFVLDAATTCSGSSSLEPGQTCAVAVDFAPQVPGSPLTDAVTLVDNSLNNSGATQGVALSGNGLQQTPVISVAPVTISYTTASTTLSATVAFSGSIAPTGAVSFTVDGGSAVTTACSGTASPLSCTATYATATFAAAAHTITATLATTPGFLTASGTSTLTVNPIAPTITFALANHTYGDAPVVLAASSNSSAAISYSVVSGPATVNGSTLTITGAGAVTVQASQIAAGNYIAGSQSAEFSVAQAALTASIVGNPTKVYDGTVTATLGTTNYQLLGLVGADSFSVNQTAGSYAAAAAGTETVTATFAASNFTVVSGSLANYTLPSGASGAGSITPAALSLTAGSYAGVYDGNAHALSGCVVSSNPDGLTCTNSPVGPVGPDVGGATVTAVISGATSNYNVTQVSGSWSITPLAVSVTAGSYSGTYDGNSHAVSACISSYAGVACSNSPASVGPGVGSGAIHAVASFTTGNATDYTVTKTAGSYSITKLAASVTPNAATKVYGTADPALSGTLSGFLPGDGVAATYSRVSGESVGGSPYTISATLSPAAVLTNYNITYNTAGFTITKATPTVTWPTPAAITYGAALSSAQLNATASVAGTFAYTPAAGTVLHAGTQTLSVTFTPADTSNYNPVTSTVALTVNKATPTVTWPKPAAINYGTLLGSTQLNATASVAGTFVYTPAAGSLLTGGTQALSVNFTPTDTIDYNSVSAANTITVNESTVSLGISSGTQTYETWTNFVLGPSYSGSRVPTGTVTLYDNGVAWVTLPLGGNGLAYYTSNPPLSAGVHNLTVSYSGNAYYPPGLSGVATITVLPAPVNFQASCFGALVYTQAYQCTVNLSASTTSPPVGSIQYSLDGASPTTVAINSAGNAPFTVPTIPTAGSHTLVITYGGQGNYAAAKPITYNFTTQKGQTELQVYPSTYFVAHGSAVTLSGSATSIASGVPSGLVTFYDNGTAIGTSTVGANGAVSYTVSSIAKGSHSYSASYAGAANYTSATSATSFVTVY